MPRATDDQPKPSVSVVIAAYNAEPFIERAIRSALDQTHPVEEVIVVDDASTDETVAAVMKISAEDERVKLLSLPTNGGPAKARNAGFTTALGEWIAVLDADDAYLPDRLSHLISKSDEADILADSFLFYHPATDSVSGDTGDGWEQVDLLTFADARRDHWDFGLFQPVFRRSFLEQHVLRYPEEIRHGEDFILAFEAIARGARYWISWRPGYLYTTRKSGWSRTVIDYGAMAKAFTLLCDRTDLDLSSNVRAKLRDRINYTNGLHLRESVKGALSEKRFIRALAISATHPVIWKMAIEKIGRDLLSPPARPVGFRNSANYWELRYIGGGNSGAGSYNRLAQFKAKLLNDFVERNGIRSVVEFGSGDGAQLELAHYPAYVGIDVSRAAIAAIRQRFKSDATKVFYHSSEVPAGISAELSLSLDVVYHLLEDDLFDAYMRDLFDAATRYAIIYSSNSDDPGPAAHVRHREFTKWVEQNRPDFALAERVPNAFPYDESNPDDTSFADFYVFERRLDA